jgi:hypothetical protein
VASGDCGFLDTRLCGAEACALSQCSRAQPDLLNQRGPGTARSRRTVGGIQMATRS